MQFWLPLELTISTWNIDFEVLPTLSNPALRLVDNFTFCNKIKKHYLLILAINLQILLFISFSTSDFLGV